MLKAPADEIADALLTARAAYWRPVDESLAAARVLEDAGFRAVALVLLGTIAVRRGELEHAFDLLQEAEREAQSSDSRELTAMLCAARSRLSFFSGAYHVALSLAHEAVALADALPPGPLRLDARFALTLVQDNVMPGQGDPRDLLEAARVLDDPAGVALAHNDAACLFLHEDLEAAAREAELAVAGGASLGPEHGLLRAFALSTRGDVKLAQGDVDGALDDLRAAASELVLKDEPYLSAMIAYLLSQALSQSGRTDDALATARRALEVLGERLPHARILLLRQEAECLRASGRCSDAYEALSAAGELAQETALELSRRHSQLQQSALEAADARRRADELEAAQAERARLLARTVEVAEDERSRVAIELHDGPIQRLTVAALSFDRLELRLAHGDLDGAAEIAREVRAQLVGEMAALRQLMSELRPPVIDERGLAAALSDCAHEVLRGTGAGFELSYGLDGMRLTGELETVVYRVAREALVNAARHSRATRVTLTLEPAGNDALRLRVADDGCGFEPAGVPERPWAHLGVVGMRERIESVEGSFALTSVPGAGTTVEATLPLRVRPVS